MPSANEKRRISFTVLSELDGVDQTFRASLLAIHLLHQRGKLAGVERAIASSANKARRLYTNPKRQRGEPPLHQPDAPARGGVNGARFTSLMRSPRSRAAR